MKGKQISKDWDISSDFLFDTTENREVKLVLQAAEESIWRQSGKFTEADKQSIQEIYGVLRAKTPNDKAWYEADQKSLDEFLDEVNKYENRNQFLEECKNLCY